MPGFLIVPAHEHDEQSFFSPFPCFNGSLSGEPYRIKEACEFLFREYPPLAGNLKNRFAGCEGLFENAGGRIVSNYRCQGSSEGETPLNK
jgi:hypothetical protein